MAWFRLRSELGGLRFNDMTIRRDRAVKGDQLNRKMGTGHGGAEQPGVGKAVIPRGRRHHRANSGWKEARTLDRSTVKTEGIGCALPSSFYDGSACIRRSWTFQE